MSQRAVSASRPAEDPNRPAITIPAPRVIEFSYDYLPAPSQWVKYFLLDDHHDETRHPTHRRETAQLVSFSETRVSTD